MAYSRILLGGILGSPPMATEFLQLSGRYTLLTKAEEIELGRRIQRWLQWEGKRKCPANIVRSGMRAREKFVLCNLRLVTRVAKGYTRRLPGTGLTFEDLLHEGVFGLQRAAEKYDPECGYAYSTYAMWWIRQSISRAIEMRGGVIHVSSGARRKLRKFQQEAMRGGTLVEIMERAELRDRDLFTIEQAAMCANVVEFDGLELRDAI